MILYAEGLGGADPAICFGDPPRLFAKRAQLGLAEIFPTVGNRDEPPLFFEGFEGQPTAAVAFGEGNAALAGTTPVGTASALSPLPRQVSGTPIGIT